ncbi:MAG: NAD(P)H-binding protein [Gammaproteobacteria bacterium]|nr:NAD(P)H-binding protein [Gammaproteobacteria bacterium]
MLNQQNTIESSAVTNPDQPTIAIVIGGSGLVGRQLLMQLVSSGHYQTVYVVVRKAFDLPITSSEASLQKTLLQWLEIPDFSQMKSVLEKIDLTNADAFSALGSTLKQAGSKAAFYQIDHDYNLVFAQVTHQQGARHLLLVSAMGADASSIIYYNRVKGELESDVQKIGFEQVSIFRPSLLIGARSQETRLAEGFAQKLFTMSQSVLPATFSSRPIEAGRVALAMWQVAQKPQEQATAQVQIYSNQMMLRTTLAAAS